MEHELEYIRKTYGVPAEIGRSILFNGSAGEIVGAQGARLKIRLDERPLETLLVHPTWMIDYYLMGANFKQ